MKRKMLAAASLAAGLAISGGMLSAQQRPDQMSDMGAMMATMQACPMMQNHMAGPAAALRHREALQLSEAQLRELEGVRDEARERRGGAMDAMRRAHEELEQASGAAGFDEARAATALDRLGDAHKNMAMDMLRDRARVREILTPEQSAKLDELGSGMMDMMQMMMRMMGSDSMGGMHMRPDTTGGAGIAGMGMMTMEDCPMMQHGNAGSG